MSSSHCNELDSRSSDRGQQTPYCSAVKVKQGSEEDLLIGHHIGEPLLLIALREAISGTG
jgi:hypothetical protein